jgi:hypothetical protein
VALRRALQAVRYPVPILLRLDGRELKDVGDAAAALCALAERATTQWLGGSVDDLPARWSALESHARRHMLQADRVEWRALATQRRPALAVGGPAVDPGSVTALWATIANLKMASAVIVVEHADQWIDGLAAADLLALARWCTTERPRGVGITLLGRSATPLRAVLGADQVEDVPPLDVESAVSWLRRRFADGGWDLAAAGAHRLIAGADAQPWTLARLADHLWRTLPAPPGDVSTDQISAAARDAMRVWGPVYDALWGACTPVQREVLRLVLIEGGRHLTRGRDPAIRLGPSTIQRAVEALQARGIVWREAGHGGRVRFADALLGLWIAMR